MDKKIKDLLTVLMAQDGSILKALAMCLLLFNEDRSVSNDSFSEDDYIKLVLKVLDTQRFCIAHLTYEEQVLAAIKLAILSDSVDAVLDMSAESLASEIDQTGVEQLDQVASEFYERRWAE